jgi:hypothetical protein
MYLDPFPGLEILVVFEKMLNGFQTQGVHVLGFLPMGINGQDPVLRHRE